VGFVVIVVVLDLDVMADYTITNEPDRPTAEITQSIQSPLMEIVLHHESSIMKVVFIKVVLHLLLHSHFT
jgi:hypothetical protein